MLYSYYKLRTLGMGKLTHFVGDKRKVSFFSKRGNPFSIRLVQTGALSDI